MNELQEQLQTKKKTGVVDIKLLALENPNSYLNPAEKILARTVKVRVVDLDQQRIQGIVPFIPANFSEAQVGDIGEKQIVIPSMFTMSKLIASHFNTLDKLKRRVLLLKQSFLKQVNQEESWEQIEHVIQILEVGSRFLRLDDFTLKQGEPAVYEDFHLKEDEELATELALGVQQPPPTVRKEEVKVNKNQPDNAKTEGTPEQPKTNGDF